MELVKKIESRAAHVGVIGLGYVGLPLVIEFCRAGFQVTGFDVDKKKVRLLNEGRSYIKHIDLDAASNVLKDHFKPTSDFALLGDMDCIIVCVPTPLTKNREPDMTYVFTTTETVAKYLKNGQIVILESTTYPGTTDQDMRAILEKAGLKAGTDFYLAFSPEREDPNNGSFSTGTIPKVVGGYTKACLEAAKALYDTIVVRTVPVSSTRAAEAAKLLENIYRSVNIALVNELKVLFDHMGIDVWEVIDAAKTKPFGFQAFYPGPGLGGHCIAGSEMVWVKNGSVGCVSTLETFFNAVARSCRSHGAPDGSEWVVPEGWRIASLDTITGERSWKPISYFFRRSYRGKVVTVTTQDNRTLTVTESHPMLKIEGNSVQVAEAKDLRKGDLLPVVSSGDIQGAGPLPTPHIDLINELGETWCKRVRVKKKEGSWREHKDAIYRAEQSGRKYDWVRGEVIPLSILWRLERDGLRIDHKDLVLAVGKGKTTTSFPAVVEIDEMWARLIGYFLSEGCATPEKGNYRVRITINSEEEELYQDIALIAKEKGLAFSSSLSRRWKTRYVRIGSPLLGWLLCDRLGCGKDSYSMKVPDELMGLTSKLLRALVMGLFRGDGDVHLRSGVREYRKNGHNYAHHDNCLTVGYFSINNAMLHQVFYLLTQLNILPSFKKGKNRLIINGHDQLERMAGWFLDSKAKKMSSYFENVRRPTKKRTSLYPGSTTIKTVDVRESHLPVYSLEVADNHTFAIGQGLYVHNCIPIDPFYLTWKAREYEFVTRFIELAGEINTSMPDYVVAKVMKALNDRSKAVKGARVLMLGLAYKQNVDDDRESPSYRLIEKLEELGAQVEYNDPYIPVIRPSREYARFAGRKSVPVKSGYDLILIATAHDEYGQIDFGSFGVPVVDTRHVVRTKADWLYQA